MLFRRHNPTPVALPVALIAPSTDQDATQPQRFAFNPFARTPKTLEEVLSISAQVPITSSNRSESSTKNYTFATPVRARYPQRGASSRKTGHATIHTDATEGHEAFESDAFAVHMPTTRLPILDHPIPSTKTSPSAQAEAYQTYKEKARQVRESNNSTGVRVPSKIVSYDYASPRGSHQTIPYIQGTNEPLSSPKPAGSFPISPPLPQSSWTRPERVNHIQTPSRNLGEPSRLYTPRKPLRPSNHVAFPEMRSHHRNDSEAGASRSTPSPTQPAPIRVRIKPRILIPETQRVQEESRYHLYNRRSPTLSPPTSRSPSPVKFMPNFTRQNSVEGDSLFGYRSRDLAGTTAGAGSSSGSDKEKDNPRAAEKPEKAEKTSPKRTVGSRWPWLRPSGPRLAKPTLTPVVMSNITPRTIPESAAPRISTYVSPFERHATPPLPTSLRSPVSSRPSSPRKTMHATAPAPQGEFETGFAQIKHLAYILCKIGFILYAIVALWYVLEAAREAFHTISAPFRLIRFLGGFVWLGVMWLTTFAGKIWEGLGGFKITLK
ncbi:hypothetical protein T440DRAFT_540158 [Plenodomus tracheiphilus IPT5]|uniref:Uncharacterized protein n=1 Tax=Plenodomus tracheiphilus IPT5 TaxID=1408161 RepID=A0A6A7AVA2_9PLEO|nr:hypothetical protein T440DRAFT_540158 [Plenodomus tracheiphilus IPT5]